MENEKIKNLKIYKKLLLLILAGSLSLTGCSNKEKKDNGNDIFKIEMDLDDLENLNNVNIFLNLIENRNSKNINIEKVLSVLETDSKQKDREDVHLYKNKYGFVKKANSFLRKSLDEDPKIKFSKYEKLDIIFEKNGYYYVNCDGKKGFVNKRDVKQLPQTFIEVDIANQILKLYKNGKIVLKSPVVTGLDNGKRETPVGIYSTSTKDQGITLAGDDYASFVNYWIAFIGSSHGFHDASWRTEFGGEIYKTNGSHGCVNMPIEKVSKLYEKVESDTKVLIHK